MNNGKENIKSQSNSATPIGDKMTIVKEPKESDVLLGQGHYRHAGNQRLNKIVDAKVLEYKEATRPFKTYMVHEIVQKLRKKDGVRFLKELVNKKGWVVVNDDKEAKEKCSQRFQYAMRKMAETPPVPKGAPVKNVPPTEAVPEPQPNLIWKGTSVKVPFLPVFHQLKNTSVMVDDDINAVSKRLLDCFHIIGVQESFNIEEASAKLTTISENLKMQMNLWKPLGARGVIVELVNLSGDMMTFQRNSRYILEAATGLFDTYKHTLNQSWKLTTSSVQDHVTAFSATNPPPQPHAKRNTAVKNNNSAAEAEVKDTKQRGWLPVFSDRPVQELKVPAAKPRESIPTSICVKRDTMVSSSFRASPFTTVDSSNKPPPPPPPKPIIDRPLEGSGTKDQAGTSSILKKPSPKRLAPKVSLVDKKDSEQFSTAMLHSSDSMLGRFDEAKAAFSRWETGANGSSSKTAKHISASRNANSQSARRVSLPSKIAQPPAHKWSKMARSSPEQAMKCYDSCDEDPYKTTAKMDPAKTFPLSAKQEETTITDSTAKAVVNDGEVPYQPPLMYKWAEPSTSEQMKCDSSIDEDLFRTKSPMELNTDSIRRLSLTGEDNANQQQAALPNSGGDIYEPLPLEQWAEALANQEMKCDSSFEEDDAFTDYNLASNQSWIPSTFFGMAAPPSSQQTNLKVTSPPSPAGSFCSHVSMDMRSLPSPSPSFTSHISVEVYSLPSPSNSFNSKCSLAKNSLPSARMDEAPSPSMFHSDQSEDGLRVSQKGSRHTFSDTQSYQDAASMLGAVSDAAVPPTIFVDSCSIDSAA